MAQDYIGTDAADSLAGDSENNTLRGLGGDDTLTGGWGDDLIEGGAGSDTFVFDGFGNDTIFANEASGPAGVPGSVETLLLGSWLTPEDLVVKRVGDDLAVQTYGSTLLKGYFDPDAASRPDFRIQFEGGSVLDQATLNQLLDLYRDDTIAGTQGDDVLTGASGDDLLQGLDGRDTLDGGKGRDRLEGGEGDDVLAGGEGNDTLWGGAGNDLLDDVYNYSSDEFYGGDGDDTLRGSLVGDKYLEGGAGSDTYVYLPWVNNVRVVEAPNAGDHDRLVMGDASDPLLSLTPDQIFLYRDGDSLLLFSDVIQSHGDSTSSVVGIDHYFSDDPAKRSGLETIEFSDGTIWTRAEVDQALRDGTNFNDVRVGTDGADSISGKGGDDDLTGGAGNDTLDGGAGEDALRGGDGDDVLLGGAGNDYLLSGGDGNDFIDAGAGNPDAIDLWSASEFLLSGDAGNDTLIGSALSETISGGAGDDVIRLGAVAGYDTITGDPGAGFDVLEWDVDSSQVASVNWGYNNDPEVLLRLKDPNGEFDYDVRTTVHLGDFYDPSTLAPTSRSIDEIRFKDGVVWTVDEILRRANQVDEGDNRVHGSAGNDVINAGGGNDTVHSGAGNDTVTGGAGLDSIRSGDGNDIVRGGADFDYLNGGAGNDRIFGGGDTDYVEGDDGNDWLDGEQGDDNIFGGAGADMLIGGDGADGLGGGLGNDVLRGGAGNDTLRGDDGADTLHGGAGNDSLDGGLGADRLDGGEGDDVYEVNDAGDVVAEAAGRGVDEVRSSVSFTLGANIERLVLTNTPWSRVDGTGNAQDNILTGTEGDNRLDGRGGNDLLTADFGNDTLAGGVGNDTLDGSGGDDLYLFNRGGGADRIIESYGLENADTLQIGGANSRQLWFTKAGDDLNVGIVGTHDSVTIDDWYLDGYGKVENIVAGDGKTLDHGKVDALVNAMAAFTPPAAGQTTLDRPTLNALQPVLAASWA